MSTLRVSDDNIRTHHDMRTQQEATKLNSRENKNNDRIIDSSYSVYVFSL